MSSLYRLSDSDLLKLKKCVSRAAEVVSDDVTGDPEEHLVMSWMHDCADDVRRELERRRSRHEEGAERLTRVLVSNPDDAA